MEAYIPINKGNYSMEVQERERLFEQYRGEGWEEAYATYRRNWSEYPKKQFVSEYPLQVDIELSSLCNLRCPMCFSSKENYEKKVNRCLMDDRLFYKIMDEIGGKVPAVRLSLRGEPTLHPNILEFIRVCKLRGIGEVSFLTNGSTLSRDFSEELIKSGVDWITVSVDGIGHMYESIRKPNRFIDIYQNIIDMKSLKDRMNSHKPVIKIQSIWPAIRENAEEFYNLFAPYSDLIAFNPLIDYLGRDEDILYESKFSCPQLYQRIIICADGLASMCTNNEENDIVIGDANKETIYEIWHGNQLNEIRQKQKEEGGFMKLPVCKKCYLPRKTEENEYAIVNDREIVIRNYVNRKQIIGG